MIFILANWVFDEKCTTSLATSDIRDACLPKIRWNYNPKKWLHFYEIFPTPSSESCSEILRIFIHFCGDRRSISLKLFRNGVMTKILEYKNKMIVSGAYDSEEGLFMAPLFDLSYMIYQIYHILILSGTEITINCQVPMTVRRVCSWPLSTSYARQSLQLRWQLHRLWPPSMSARSLSQIFPKCSRFFTFLGKYNLT